MYKIYALKSLSHNYIYVGLTSNLERRINQHNQHHEKTTRAYAPFKLLYQEQCDNRVKARIREKYLKSGTGKEFLKSLV
jgi:putative endonuclease